MPSGIDTIFTDWLLRPCWLDNDSQQKYPAAAPLLTKANSVTTMNRGTYRPPTKMPFSQVPD